MSRNNPIRFVYRDVVPDSTLTGTAPDSGALDNLKNHYRAQVAVWDNPTFVSITGSGATNKVCDTFTILDHTLSANFVVQIRLYAGEDLTGDLVYDSGMVPASKQVPLGQWRFGVDPFGTSTFTGAPFIHWMPEPKIFKSWRLFILRIDGTEGISMRMLHLGLSTKLSDSYDWGAVMSHRRSNDIGVTQSGGAVATSNQLAGKRMQFNLSQMNDADRLALIDMESITQGEHFIVSGQPENAVKWQESEGTFLGMFEQPLVYSRRFFDWNSSDTVTVTEV